MRNTRNASKSTPPAKKTSKGTPNKGTPRTPVPEEKVEAKALPTGAEKEEESVSAEADPSVAPDAPMSSLQADVNSERVDALVAAGTVELTKEAVDFKCKASTPKQKTNDTSVKEADLLEASKRGGAAAEESKLGPTEQADSTTVQVTLTETTELILNTDARPSNAEPSQGVQVSKAVHKEEMPLKAGKDEEMQEGGQDEVGDVGMDDANDPDDEDDDEEGEEEEDKGIEDLGEEKPASDRQKRKRCEVFVGGLDKDATAEEVKKAFEDVGEVVDVRLTMRAQSGKNRGYAFVRFATVDQAGKAASDLDRIKIRDKECAVVPSEENDTLFLGNLCKSWNSEKILEKLKEYGVDGIDKMTLVEDRENEGHSKGHAFLEFMTYTDALKAFMRLSKRDAIFGCDKSARVAWAAGSSEPDEIVMAKVKAVFVDNMPAQWDEQKIKELFSKYGEIERLVLAKNIPRSRRQDFAFVNFAARDAAVAAIEALNDTELADGDKGVKLKVELAKPTLRRKRMRGHRGSHPVGDRPIKQKQKQVGDRNEQRKSDGSQGGHGSSQRNSRGEKRTAAGESAMREQRSWNKRARGSKFPRAGASAASGSGALSDEDYLPMGVRMASGLAPSRDFSSRPPREPTYPRRAERDHVYPVVMRKQLAPSVQRGYPRARVEYADPSLGGVPLYSDPLRATPLGHSSLSHTLPPAGGYGYPTVLLGAADYNGRVPADVDLRAASYYGGRSGKGYSLPSGSHPYF